MKRKTNSESYPMLAAIMLFLFALTFCSPSVTTEDIPYRTGEWDAGTFGNHRAVVQVAEEMTCINTGGINWDGQPLDKTCSVEEGKVQALWCGLQVPKDAERGMYLVLKIYSITLK